MQDSEELRIERPPGSLISFLSMPIDARTERQLHVESWTHDFAVFTNVGPVRHAPGALTDNKRRKPDSPPALQVRPASSGPRPLRKRHSCDAGSRWYVAAAALLREMYAEPCSMHGRGRVVFLCIQARPACSIVFPSFRHPANTQTRTDAATARGRQPAGAASSTLPRHAHTAYHAAKMLRHPSARRKICLSTP